MEKNIIINEKDLQSCLVKLLFPKSYEINGTGFFCHPEGYILTCYHVIKPYIEKEQGEVCLFYKDEKLSAKICHEYSIKGKDIATLKLTGNIKFDIYYPLLDVHNRWTIDDRIYSHGYPIGYYEKAGKGTTGSIGGFTQAEDADIIQINDLSITNIDHGYSGSPVFHLRTKKIIGIIFAYEQDVRTQAFFIPINPLIKLWTELKDIHDIYKKIRLRIAKEAEEKLNEQLRGCVYISLRLEYGKIKEKEHIPEIKKVSEREYSFNREWENFDVRNLLPFSGFYILLSSVGSGKTTFLYWLAKELSEKTDNLPILMTCENLEDIKPNSWNELKIQLISRYNQFFGDEDIKDLLCLAYKKQKLIFIFDALDQIKGNNYLYLIDKIFTIVSHSPVLISSRPSQVLSFEERENISLLRLCSFSKKDQKQYFGSDYKKAAKVSALESDLTSIPMLAYMVMTLIKKTRIENIYTRTDIYEKFLEYILYKHAPNKYYLESNIQLSHDIQETLKRLSYESLALKIPQIQKISEKLFECINPKIPIDYITRFGMIKLVLEREHWLFFTHKSFQEFLAAKYVNDEYNKGNKFPFKSIMLELWAPK